MAITKFSGGYHFLSNFYPCKIKIDAWEFDSTEAAYQAMKCNRAKDVHAFVGITPGEAKKLGRLVELRPNWERVKIDVMRYVLIQKFSDPILMAMLDATKGQELIEGNTWGDRFWGQCPVGDGRNELGKLLMSIRDDITRIRI